MNQPGAITPGTRVRPNIPLADELADVREKLKTLKQREDELRRIMLTDPSARTGAHFLVEIRDVSKTRTDYEELRNCHPDLVAAFTFQLTERRVELRGITEHGEIVSLRRKEKTT